MATVKRRANRGGQWEVRYRDPEGKQRAKLFDRKVDADQFAATTTADLVRGQFVDPNAGRVTLREYAEAWQANQVHRATTAAQVGGNLRRHVYPTLGDRPLGKVTRSDVQAWVKGRAVDLAPGTVEVVFRYLSAIFATAVEDRIIRENPCSKVKLPKREPTQVLIPTVEQVRALEAGLPERYRALVTLAAGTGLRQGEAFGLTLERVDFLRRQLRVDRQLVLLPGTQGPQFGPPKTAASYRTVPLPQVVVDALAAHLAAFPVTHPDGLIFTTVAGLPIRRTRFSDVWRPVAKEAGLEPGTGFHALRHFYASALIRYGESVKVVQSRLGHATAAETLDTYGHLWPDSEDRTRDAIDAALSCAPDVRQSAAPDA